MCDLLVDDFADGQRDDDFGGKGTALKGLG